MDKELKIPGPQRNQSPGHEAVRTIRRREIMKRRKRGWTLEQIGKDVGCSTQTVSNDLKYLLTELVQLTAAETEHYVQLELERLDELQAAVWDKAVKGSLFHVDRVLAIMDRRAKLLGLNKPLQHILAGSKKSPIQVEQTHKLEDELYNRMLKLADINPANETPNVENILTINGDRK